MKTVKTMKLIAAKSHKYKTRALEAGDEYDVPIREAAALVATRKAKFAPKGPRAVQEPAKTVEVKQQSERHATADYRPSEDLTKLRKEAEAAGVYVDLRWGRVRLQQEIDHARANRFE